MAEVKARVHSKTIDELFADAMSGIKSDFGNNPNARTAEVAVSEMHRRLKLAFEAHGEIFVAGRDGRAERV